MVKYPYMNRVKPDFKLILKILGLSVLFISILLSGYAAGRGYKTYEINKEKKLEEIARNSNEKQNPKFATTNLFPGWKIPKINLEINKDNSDGYNLKIRAISFWFTSQTLGNRPVPNTGYANIFINNKFVGRSYGEIQYLDNSLFKNGTNTITVVLAANDNSLWTTKEGTKIEASIDVFK